jgi:hypothetical protein
LVIGEGCLLPLNPVKDAGNAPGVKKLVDEIKMLGKMVEFAEEILQNVDRQEEGVKVDDVLCSGSTYACVTQRLFLRQC